MRQYPGTLILLALLITGYIAITAYLAYKIYTCSRKVFPLYLVALLLGLVAEYRRISGKWSTVLWTALGAYTFSFFAFAGGREQKAYVFEDHLITWPYYFLPAFIVIAMAVQYNAITRSITEGTTLLLTLAINYWIIENNCWHSGTLWIKLLVTANAFLSVFSIYHALSYRSLGKGSRLMLSLWSAVITIVLAIDNLLTLYPYRNIEQMPAFSVSALFFLRYFLLGVSSIYIVQNLTMVAAYIPGKRYIETVREMNDIHLKRFSGEQVYIGEAIFIILISSAGFIANYFLHFLPPNCMIWITITFAPLFLYLVQPASRRQV